MAKNPILVRGLKNDLLEKSGALGVRSQREGSSGENDFTSTAFYLHKD